MYLRTALAKTGVAQTHLYLPGFGGMFTIRIAQHDEGKATLVYFVGAEDIVTYYAYEFPSLDALLESLKTTTYYTSMKLIFAELPEHPYWRPYAKAKKLMKDIGDGIYCEDDAYRHQQLCKALLTSIPEERLP